MSAFVSVLCLAVGVLLGLALLGWRLIAFRPQPFVKSQQRKQWASFEHETAQEDLAKIDARIRLRRELAERVKR